MTNSFETGGSEKQFITLAQSLEATDLQPHIGCIKRQGRFLNGLPEVSEFPVGNSLYGVGSMQARWRLARYLRRSHIEVAHSFDFYTNLLMIPAARMSKVPVVIGSHRQLGDLLGTAKFRTQLATLRWCDRVICNSCAAAKRLVEGGLPEQKTVVIGNGLAPSAFAETAPLLPRAASTFRVGMVARMNAPSKKHEVLLRAAARVLRTSSATEVLLAGDGPLRPALESLAQELGIAHQVRFLGDCRDIPAVLASVDVSVLPSTSESLSNAILESMAAGIPTIAANVGGNPELLADGRGILLSEMNEESLAIEIERLQANPQLRADLANTAKDFAEANFTIESVSQRYAELYAKLLAEKQARREHTAPTRTSLSATTGRGRVLVVAASARYVGGQSVQAKLLLDGWQGDSDYEATFVPIDPPLPTTLNWVEKVPALRTIMRQPFYLATLWRGLDDVDIAHIFSASYWSFLIATAPAALLARLRRKGVVIHYHSGEAMDHLQRSAIARSILARADRLVVPSRYLVDVFREFGLHAEAVPNVVNLSQFPFKLRDPLRPHLICTRGFHPYYCVDMVVRAFAEVKKAYPAARLDLVGGGPLEPAIRELVRQLELKDVNFVGVASRKEIGRLYDQADIFINASYLDNMPVSVLEAFACGTPVVSTTPESMRSLIEHGKTGLLSPVGDPHALANNVLRLLKEPSLAKNIVANAREESKRFQWKAARSQWVDLYRSLCVRSEEKEPASASTVYQVPRS